MKNDQVAPVLAARGYPWTLHVRFPKQEAVGSNPITRSTFASRKAPS